jgi:hypothetical protein
MNFGGEIEDSKSSVWLGTVGKNAKEGKVCQKFWKRNGEM